MTIRWKRNEHTNVVDYTIKISSVNFLGFVPEVAMCPWVPLRNRNIRNEACFVHDCTILNRKGEMHIPHGSLTMSNVLYVCTGTLFGANLFDPIVILLMAHARSPGLHLDVFHLIGCLSPAPSEIFVEHYLLFIYIGTHPLLFSLLSMDVRSCTEIQDPAKDRQNVWVTCHLFNLIMKNCGDTVSSIGYIW